MKVITNKVECGTAAEMCCTKYHTKMQFFMPYPYDRRIIKYPFYVKNDKGDTGVGYRMAAGQDLMVQLIPIDDFKRNDLEWECVIIHMKYIDHR